MRCPICGNESNKCFNHMILNKYNIDYFHCDNCDFLHTEEPYWLRESYKESINLSDTGYISRNLSLSGRAFIFFLILFGKREKYLDYAGGYGMATRVLRDFGLDFYWDDKYTKNLFAQGFEYKNQIIKALTCFECFEHFVCPTEEIEKMLSISRNILFSTVIKSDVVPPENWWYYGFNHGQHISFYSMRTLKYLANKYKLFLYSNGRNFHYFSDKKISKVGIYFLMKAGALPWGILSKYILSSKTLDDSNYLISKSGKEI